MAPRSEARTPLPAGKVRRVASGLIDAGVFVSVVVVGASVFVDSADPAMVLAGPVIVSSLLQVLAEVLLGGGLGRLLTGTRVVDSEGGRPPMRQRLARVMFKNRVFITAISVLREARARHDRLSGTYVVRSAQPWKTQ